MSKYHMNKKDREITDNEEISRLLRNGKYAVIAMCRNNEPYVVTLSYGYDEKTNALYFHSALKGLKLEFIKENTAVCATIIEDRGYRNNECEHHYSSLVLWGKMTIVEAIEEKKHAMEILLNHLESNPGPIRERNFKNERVFNNFAMLKLEIGELTAKQGQ